jgi:hypothetical protein
VTLPWLSTLSWRTRSSRENVWFLSIGRALARKSNALLGVDGAIETYDRLKELLGLLAAR